MDTSNLTIASVQPSNAVKIQKICFGFILVFNGGHLQFNYRRCPNLNLEAVNTVCLGFSDEFIEFSQSWFYRWFLAKITDFGGEDEGFLAKITDFWRRLQIFRQRLQIFRQRLWISLSLPMFTVHTNEQGTCTCLH